MYFTLYVIQGPTSFYIVTSEAQENISIAKLVFHFGYFALAAQSSCGFGDYFPTSAATQVLVSFHLLVSMIYIAVILGLGLSHLFDRLTDELHCVESPMSIS